MHRYELEVLKVLKERKSADLQTLINDSNIGHDGVLWAIENLSQQKAIEVRRGKTYSVRLTEEARRYANDELPETKLINRVSKARLKVNEIKDNESRIGLQWAKSKDLIKIDKDIITITAAGRSALSKGIPEESVLRMLNKDPTKFSELQTKYSNELNNLIKRKLLIVGQRGEIESVGITDKGLGLLKSGAGSTNEIDALTKKMIMGKEWNGKKFKKYEINVPIEKEPPIALHPLRRTINQLKDAYLSIGFKEVSGPIVMPAFWTFDSLFVPQDHPARDAQDTFYLSNPEYIELKDKNLVSMVSEVHQRSWHSDWSEKIASQAVLRTHTTSVSVREIFNLQSYKDYHLPLKLFSVGRTFRNENVDYKHLADFYQCDGIVIGEALTLSNLFDVLIKIYKALGIKIRFKPSYFPFVEPGVEVQGYYEPKDIWLELAGAGIIRREITGITKKNIRVLAWGGGVERILLMKDKRIESIAELYNRGIGWLREMGV